MQNSHNTSELVFKLIKLVIVLLAIIAVGVGWITFSNAEAVGIFVLLILSVTVIIDVSF